MRNKKAILAAPLVDFWSIIIFIFIIIVFYYIIQSTVGGSEDIKARQQTLVTNAVLEAYLRTPVSVDGKEIQMSQLIIDAHITGDYTKLIEESNSITGKFPKYGIDIFYPDRQLSINRAASLYRYNQVSSFIPAPNGGTIKIILYLPYD